MSGANLSDASLAALEPTAPLTSTERVDVRRFCGYSVLGPDNASFESYRFFTAYGTMEYRLTNLATEEFQQLRQFLGQLYLLEQAILNASSGLDTAQAAVFTRNPREMAERNSLYRQWRRALCDFIGVPPGPALGQRASIVI